MRTVQPKFRNHTSIHKYTHIFLAVLVLVRPKNIALNHVKTAGIFSYDRLIDLNFYFHIGVIIKHNRTSFDLFNRDISTETEIVSADSEK